MKLANRFWINKYKGDFNYKIPKSFKVILSIGLGVAIGFGALKCSYELNNFNYNLIDAMQTKRTLKEITEEINERINPKFEDKYEISDLEDLIDLSRDYRNVYYKLTKDIDCKNKELIPIGNQQNPFTGTFDGNGYTISNFSINGKNYNGLFGFIDGTDNYSKYSKGSLICNLKIKNAKVVGKWCNGLIVGYITNSALINCSSEGDVIGEKLCGNLAGFSYDAFFRNIECNGNVKCSELSGKILGGASNCVLKDISYDVKTDNLEDKLIGIDSDCLIEPKEKDYIIKYLEKE